MNRTERLYAVTEELRRAGRTGTTGRRLARMLEVSERTIKRDISALQQAGATIWAQAGPGGGYVLDSSASLPPVNFSPAQAVAVAVALATLPPGSPFAVDGTAARGKVFDALGPADRTRAQHLASRIWVDHASAGADVDATILRALEQSLSLQRVLTISYRSGAGEASRRSVEPIALAWAEGRWYLVAWCRLRTAIRWFRVERVERADVTREQFEPRDVTEIGKPPASAAPVG